jgi:hypothetical protein
VAAVPESLRHVGAAPYTNVDTSAVMDHAVCELADRRFVSRLDVPAQLHLLASLIAQADGWMAEQVTVARADGTSWADIGRLIGANATAARKRWAPQTHPTANSSGPGQHQPRASLPDGGTHATRHHQEAHLTD